MLKYSVSIKNYQDYIDAWQKIKDKVPANIVLTEIRCKYCNSKEISKFGSYKSVQRWWCKECKRKFADNRSFPGTRLPVDAVYSALLMFYKGVPLKSIRQQLEEEFSCYPSESTIYRLIKRLTKESLDDAKKDHPNVGSNWLAYESHTKIGSKEYWILDLIDFNTHFLLASALSHNRTVDDIRMLLEHAREKAKKIPEVLTTRRFSKYSQGIELSFGAAGCQIQFEPFTKEETKSFTRYWLRMQNKRKIVLHHLKLINMAQLVLQGWTDYYNYYLNQESLYGKTPSQAAEIHSPSIPKRKAKLIIQVPNALQVL
jgi:transposase-like protein